MRGDCGCGPYSDFGPSIRDGNLGFDPLSILAFGKSAWEIGQATGIIGSGDWREKYAKAYKGVPCPNTPPSSLVLAGVASAPASLLSAISSKLQQANDGKGPTPGELGDPATVDLWMHAAMGGSDCKVSNPAVQDLPKLVHQLADLGRGFSATTSTPYGQAGGAVSYPTDYGDAMPATTGAQPVPGPSLLDQIRHIAAEAAQQAAAAVGSSAYQHLPASQQAQVQQYAATAYAQQARSTLSANLPLILAAGLGLALLTRKR